MALNYAIDAHSLIWYFTGSSRLGASAKEAMSDPASLLFLPIIALMEACHVVARGKTSIPSFHDLLKDIDSDPRIKIVPLDRNIFDISLKLTAVTEMHDRLIVATALSLNANGEGASLLTCDQNIVTSGLVATLW